jgi:PHD/YefM family antitoxin component YafN of YafNO toxin-antitoxin module
LDEKEHADFGHVHEPVHTTAITFATARENLASTLDRVRIDRDPVIITRNRDRAVVGLSLDDNYFHRSVKITVKMAAAEMTSF